MSEKIKSWRGRSVRLKPEYIVKRMEFDGHYDEEEGTWVTDKSLPMVEEFYINCPLSNFIHDPNDVFEVASDMYGIDLYGYTSKSFEVGSIEPTHQIILRRSSGVDYPYIWDAKYFDVVRKELVWVKDEEFNQ